MCVERKPAKANGAAAPLMKSMMRSMATSIALNAWGENEWLSGRQGGNASRYAKSK